MSKKFDNDNKDKKTTIEIDEINTNNEFINDENNIYSQNINKIQAKDEEEEEEDDDEDEDYTKLEYKEALENKKKITYYRIFRSYFKSNICFDINCINEKNKKSSSDFQNIKIILIILFVHTFFFFNALLFSDKYISNRYLFEEEIEGIGHFLYIIYNEYERIFTALFLSFFIIKIFRWILYEKSVEYLDEIKKSDVSIKRIELLKGLYICKILFFLPVIIIFHCIFFYFILIFGNINSNTQLPLIISMLLSLILYFIIIFPFILLISLLKFISIKPCCDNCQVSNDCNLCKACDFCYGLYKMSSFLSYLLTIIVIFIIYKIIFIINK